MENLTTNILRVQQSRQPGNPNISISMQHCFLIHCQFVLQTPQAPNQEDLSQLLPSQWGMVHLFDLCLWFGLIDTASALALRGVEGCVLEDHHNFGPFCRDSPSRPVFPCSCQGWDTCRFCCWAFPVEQGIWMEDWDVEFWYIDWHDEDESELGAIPAAREAAATPLTRAMLDLCSCDMELPFSGSPKAMARLLDIAILTGNQEATINLAKKCQVRPLRRWVMEFDLEECWEAARTALWAVADFQGLMVQVPDVFSSPNEDIPFPQALFLKSKLEDWQAIRHDLWRPKKLDNGLGIYFLERPDGPGDDRKVSLDKIRAAKDAGVDLRFCCVWTENYGFTFKQSSVTLLDVAIWCGQVNCAEACVDQGIDLKDDDVALDWHQQVLRGESLSLPWPGLDVVPSEAQTAAAAAGRAWLKRLWKSEASQKGIVLYQMILKMFNGRSFPMALVQETLTYSMPVPKIIDQLDLWEHVGDWMASIFCGPFAPEAADVDGMEVKVDSARMEGPCASDELQLCTMTRTVGSCIFGIRISKGSYETTSISHYLTPPKKNKKVSGMRFIPNYPDLGKPLCDLLTLFPWHIPFAKKGYTLPYKQTQCVSCFEFSMNHASW